VAMVAGMSSATPVPSIPVSAPTEASASAAARLSDEPVLVESKTDETTEVLANPDGTFTMTHLAGRQGIRRRNGGRHRADVGRRPRVRPGHRTVRQRRPGHRLRRSTADQRLHLDELLDDAGNAKLPDNPRHPDACHSFPPGTRVLLADGTTKPIEKVALGERVRAADPKTGRTEARAVVATWVHDNEPRRLRDLRRVSHEQEGRPRPYPTHRRGGRRVRPAERMAVRPAEQAAAAGEPAAVDRHGLRAGGPLYDRVGEGQAPVRRRDRRGGYLSDNA
jgi:hypothetical protein